MLIALKDSILACDPAAFATYNFVLKTRSDTQSQSEKLLLTLAELLLLLETNFSKLQDERNLVELLRTLHYTIKITDTDDSTQLHVSEFLERNTRNFETAENECALALQIFYQILKSASRFQDTRAVDTLVKMVLRSDSQLLRTRSLLCLKVLLKGEAREKSLKIIWMDVKRHATVKSADILTQLLDEFLNELQIFEQIDFWAFVIVLISAGKDERKYGISLIRRTLAFLGNGSIDRVINAEYFAWSPSSKKSIEANWHAYLTILENMEEKQSHLILPSLETLDRIDIPAMWLNVLYKQLLAHNNSLVLRWSVKFFLRRFTVETIDKSVFSDFLCALNTTSLYALNSSDSIDQHELEQFILPDAVKFLKFAITVNWKPVPIFVWFQLLPEHDESFFGEIEKSTLLELAAIIRKLQNRVIRDRIKMQFFDLFKKKIVNLPLADYVCLLEALFNDRENIDRSLANKVCDIFIESLAKSKDAQFKISFHLFKILSNIFCSSIHTNMEVALLKVYSRIPPEDHIWFRILVVFQFTRTDHQVEFVHSHYGLDVAKISDELTKMTSASITDRLSFLKKKFKAIDWDEAESTEVLSQIVELLSSSLYDFKEIADDPEYLFDVGGPKTIENLALLLQKTKTTVPTSYLDRLLNEMKTLIKQFGSEVPDRIASCILEYAYNQSTDLGNEYANKILDIDPYNEQLVYTVFSSLKIPEVLDFSSTIPVLQRGLLVGETVFGDEKIERDYLVTLRHSLFTIIRSICLDSVRKLSLDMTKELRERLFDLSFNLSKKKPRYFENCQHHMLKLRVMEALLILQMRNRVWDERYLAAILDENNQPNVTYLAEEIVATCITGERLKILLQQVTKYPSSTQVSLFVVAYQFCKRNENGTDFAADFVRLLLPFTMGQHFTTRLHAQIACYRLIEEFRIEDFTEVSVAIKRSFEVQPDSEQILERLKNDFRFHSVCSCKAILHRELPHTFIKKTSSKKSGLETSATPGIHNVQRKMNLEKIDLDGALVHYGDSENQNSESEMIVVASLIDRATNLGGIARTCEVLGIRNLVLDSVKHAENKEFKNLSMTAEKWLNLVEVKTSALQEFLNQKKLEGYEIVGAEQTANSVSFAEFQFPERCVLLLGHEKEGIPAHLISFLDYAVEIPQFGLVRSLNVHVTGALFMWEYCKQRLINKNTQSAS